MSCGAQALSWNVVAAAGSHSEFAAVAASIVFVVLTLLLGPQANASQPVNDDARRAVLFLLPVVFVELLLAAFFWGSISGEQVCARASAGGIAAAATLALGVQGLLVALVWFARAHTDDAGLVRHLRMLMLVLSGLAAYHVLLTVEDTMYYADGIAPGAVPEEYEWFVHVEEWLFCGAIATFLFVLAVNSTLRRFGRRPLWPAGLDGARALRAVAAAHVVHLIVAAVANGRIVGEIKSGWRFESPADAPLYIVWAYVVPVAFLLACLVTAAATPLLPAKE